jgi:cell division protein FtsX
LVGSVTATNDEPPLDPDEIVVHLSPRLSANAVDDLYSRIRLRSDVAAVTFRFAEEVSPGSTGGRFFVRTTTIDARETVRTDLESMNGVTRVESHEGTPERNGFALPSSARLGLLLALVLSVVLSLVLGRIGFRALLGTFRVEIRMMRLSGTSERTIIPPVVGLGILMGLLSGLLLIAGIYLGQYAVGEGATDVPRLADSGLVLGVTFTGLVLGLLLGSFIGLFGASVLSSREFSPLP